MSEQQVQRGIKKDFETLYGATVTKVNPGVYGAPVGHYDLIMSIPVTFPQLDYMIIPICVYVEVKMKTGKESMMQSIWGKQRRAEGKLACVARSTQDVLEYLLSQGIKL